MSEGILPQRLNQIPVLFVRGDNFTIGYTIGRQLRSLLEDTVSKSDFLRDTLLPEYETEAGKVVYDKQLALCNQRFPEYVQEIQGMSKGSNIPFHKLFLMNTEMLLTSFADLIESKNKKKEGVGCTSLMSNNNNKLTLMGHTEDAGLELLNNVFIVSAEVVNDNGELVEKFATLTYAGCLPGYTMGYNQHAVLHSVNTIYPSKVGYEKSPRAFIARKLFRAQNLEQVISIMKDTGIGISDGFSLNVCFGKSEPPQMYNIEVCPEPEGTESQVNVFEIKEGSTYAHCNKYLRIDGHEIRTMSSIHRHKVIDAYPKPETVDIIKEILSDQSDIEYPIFRNGESLDVATVAVGIFDITNRKWSIYAEQPNQSNPVGVLPLIF